VGRRAHSLSLRRLWVPRNFRTLPESSQSSAWVRSGIYVCVLGGGARNGEALRFAGGAVGRASFWRRAASPLTATPAT
jgi:hypothetical protein